MSAFNYKHTFCAILRNTDQTSIPKIFYNVNTFLRCFHLHNANCSLKSNLPVKWVRPEKILCIHPKKSGDLQPLKKVDLKQILPEFKDLEEIKSADENVMKVFSLEFHSYKSTVSYLRQDYMNRVKRHEFDDYSPEIRVAKMTADIRDMQRFVEGNPHDKRTRVRLKETIDKRKKLLKNLRIWDYKCFEYLLEKLDLVYKPYPGPEVYNRVERKRSLRMLTEKYCKDIISGKLQKYKEELESQKENFLVEKLETYKWIMKEEAYCGVKPTITDDDLKAVEKELFKVREGNKKEVHVVND